MRRVIVSLCFVFCGLWLNAQTIEKIRPDWIDEIKKVENDTLYVINFWATWCKPCVEELPFIDALTEKHKNEKLKVILVSNDMLKDYDTRLKSFVSAKQLRSEVVFMNEVNADIWIDKVNTGWSGAIPATWLLRNDIGFDFFKEGEITEEELSTVIEQILNEK